MIFKILIFGIAAYALYRLFMNDKRKNIEKSENDEAKKVADGILVRDPVCGVYVEKENSFSVRNGDVVEYFCSDDCRQKYIKQVQEQQKIQEQLYFL